MISGNRICYLHVGTGKTGTSAIQYALTQKHRELLKAGLLYPDASDNFRAVLAGQPTSGNAIAIAALLHAGSTAEAMDIIKGYSSRPEHLVLSCEGFSNVSSAALTKLAAGLAEHGYVPKCLVLFRPQVERMTSSYLQQAKANKATARVSLEHYARRMIALRGRRFDWYHRAQKLKSAFGKNNLTVLWYPALRRRGLDGVPAAAFEWLGVPSLYTPGETPRDVLVNPTPSREALAVLEEINAQGLGGKNFADRFLTAALEQGVTGTKVVLSKAVTRRIHKATLETNRRFFQEYCPDLDAEKELQPPDDDAAFQAPLDEKALTALRAIAAEVSARRAKSPAPQLPKLTTLRAMLPAPGRLQACGRTASFTSACTRPDRPRSRRACSASRTKSSSTPTSAITAITACRSTACSRTGQSSITFIVRPDATPPRQNNTSPMSGATWNARSPAPAGAHSSFRAKTSACFARQTSPTCTTISKSA